MTDTTSGRSYGDDDLTRTDASRSASDDGFSTGVSPTAGTESDAETRVLRGPSASVRGLPEAGRDQGSWDTTQGRADSLRSRAQTALGSSNYTHERSSGQARGFVSTRIMPAQRAVKDGIMERPLTAALVALGAGLAVGLVLMRRRGDDDQDEARDYDRYDSRGYSGGYEGYQGGYEVDDRGYRQDASSSTASYDVQGQAARTGGRQDAQGGYRSEGGVDYRGQEGGYRDDASTGSAEGQAGYAGARRDD